MDVLLEAHSHWRWVVLALLLVTSLELLARRLTGRPWTNLDAKLILGSRVAVHLQVAMGLVLYVLLEEWSDLGFTADHAFLALAAVGVLEVSVARSKRVEDPHARIESASTGFVIGLVLITFVILIRTV